MHGDVASVIMSRMGNVCGYVALSHVDAWSTIRCQQLVKVVSGVDVAQLSLRMMAIMLESVKIQDHFIFSS